MSRIGLKLATSAGGKTWRIHVNPDNCKNCRNCARGCQQVSGSGGIYAFDFSGSIAAWDQSRCLFCDPPPCVTRCPFDALEQVANV